jgi:oligopeptidase B
MMRKLSCILALALLALPYANMNINAQTTSNPANMNPAPVPPAAKKNPKRTTIHNETLVDDYFWLREKTNPEVVSYLESENAYTVAVMKPTEELQTKLYNEILSRIKETDTFVPYRNGQYFYNSRTEKGKQYPIYVRQHGNLSAKEEIVLDQNELAKGQKFNSIGTFSPSDDGKLLAYSMDTTGFREYILYIKDMRTGELLPDKIGKVTSAFWANDNKTLLYTTEDHAKRSYRLYRHTLGQEKEKDALVYEEKDELFRVSASRTRSKAFILIGSSSFTSSEYRYIPADRPEEAPKVLWAREANHEYYPTHHGDYFYIRTNDKGRTFRLVSAPVSSPQKENWKEVLPYRKNVMLESINFFKEHMVVNERENGLPKMRITDLKSGETHYLEFPEPVYTAFTGVNVEFDTSVFRFNYQSLVTPNSVFDYDMRTRKRTLLKQTEVLGGYDSSKYQSERIYAVAKDGTRVPISLLYRKDLKKDGKRPMLLTGYGSYGAPSNPTFSSNRLSLVDRGLIYAIAHIRGGGDLGKEWHDQGKMMNKKNTFTDFIAVAEHLIAEKYTSSDRLAITGGSAGGLLMGAVVNMRPDLFKAVVSNVPFVDVINSMLDESLPLTVGEFQEWGNPKEKAAYDYIKSYSPYDNLAARKYPAMLINTSLNDSQVMYWEPAKYVARLRTLKTDSNVLLLKTNMGAGHGGSSGRYDALKEIAFDYAFILTQLGIAN